MNETCICRKYFEGECEFTGLHRCCCDFRNPSLCKKEGKHKCTCGFFEIENCRAYHHNCSCHVWKIGPRNCKATFDHQCVCEILDHNENNQIHACMADNHDCSCLIACPIICYYNNYDISHNCSCELFGRNNCLAH